MTNVEHLPDSYAVSLGRAVLAAAELERALCRLHAQLLRYKHGVVQTTGERFDRAYDGCWALLKAFHIPQASEIMTALAAAADLWRQCEAARRTVAPQTVALNDVAAAAQDRAPHDAGDAFNQLPALADAVLEQATQLDCLTIDFQFTS